MISFASTQSTIRGPLGPAPASIDLPKGGGAIRGIGEKFATNSATGTGSISVPIAVSPGRSGFGPQLSLSYDSGSGNGPFGLGWSFSPPSIVRRTEKRLPEYVDSDVFILSGSEDLVPVVDEQGELDEFRRGQHVVRRYRPRTEGLFAGIERWTHASTGVVHWRTISSENVTALYGASVESRIADPAEPSGRTFSWLICESYDDRGNAVLYEYAEENDANVDLSQANERNRTRSANRYLKRIKYGNRVSRLVEPDLTSADWMFETVFDYDEDHYRELSADPTLEPDEQHLHVLASAGAGATWSVRPDPFSVHRSGFEVRTYRRCRRVLMFHHILNPRQGEGGYDGLVQSTEFDYADFEFGEASPDDELGHQGSTRFASHLRSVTHSGYVRLDSAPIAGPNGAVYLTYLKKSYPPLDFGYSPATLHDELKILDSSSSANLPEGLDGGGYQLVDLDGEGLSGVLSEQGGGWFYKENLGGGRFGPMMNVAPKPSISSLGGGGQQLLDLAGDGQLDLVDHSNLAPGFFERADEERWSTHRAFRQLPELDWRERGVRLIDLDGDGRPELMTTDGDALIWYPCLGEDGFGPAKRNALRGDDESGPRLALSDGDSSLFLADMCGDGLTDLVRIRNGEVCYWPNLGHGHFGPKITFDDAPHFDRPDRFDHSRIRLADIDGSGTTDIVYLGADGATIYFNQSGNRLSQPRALRSFPPCDQTTFVTAADLFGRGTACLVWSSPLPGERRAAVRFVDLMGGVKPHLLVTVENNLGARTGIRYASSTDYYLADKARGAPWLTRLPFPVHVVERVETYDDISGNLFVSRYAYHHGFYDGVEREFRGFGMVEQWDTDEFEALSRLAPDATNVEADSHTPPTLTKTWFHTGVYLGRSHVSDFFAGLMDPFDKGEYYREPGLGDVEARSKLLDDTVLPAGLTPKEEFEAVRALKGATLRQEIYALDGSSKEPHPYSVSERNFAVRKLQSGRGDNPAVFLVHPRETLEYSYERSPSEPRVGHAATLDVDDFGNVLKSAAVSYGRRTPNADLAPADRERQARTWVTYSEVAVTNAIDDEDAIRTPQACERKLFEITGLPALSGERFPFDELSALASSAPTIDFEEVAAPGVPTKRLIQHSRSYCRSDDLESRLPLGVQESQGLQFESYSLAFTPGLVDLCFGTRVDDDMMRTKGRYSASEGPGWWVPTGRTFFSPDPQHTAAEELDFARRHFFVPHRVRDQFDFDTITTYDDVVLLAYETRDAIGNLITAGQREWTWPDGQVEPAKGGRDYRVLLPKLVMDANGNRTEVAFDALGLVAGRAVMGKPGPSEDAEGDFLGPEFKSNLTASEVAHFAADPLGPVAAELLGKASSRIVYDLHAYAWTSAAQRPDPTFSASISRETHVSDLDATEESRLQIRISYSDGFSREIQSKTPSEPGPVPLRDAAGEIVVGTDGEPDLSTGDIAPRWVAIGWVIYDNKGSPVRQFDPFFTSKHEFEFEVKVGVSPTQFYDPLGRPVATLYPDRSWGKIVFDAWGQRSWDSNDTALIAAPDDDEDLGGRFRRLPVGNYRPTWHQLRTDGVNAATLAELYPDPERRSAQVEAARSVEVHAETPSQVHVDALGRTFLTSVANRFVRAGALVEEVQEVRAEFDIAGNQVSLTDALGRLAIRYRHDLMGRRIHQASMEAGERWILPDVGGRPMASWDSRGHRNWTTFDELSRPLEVRLFQPGAASEQVIGDASYGETSSDPEASNLRGKVLKIRDQAGVSICSAYDFKGNPLASSYMLVEQFDTLTDWNGLGDPTGEAFAASTSYDALNRTIAGVTPDGSVYRPRYNEANLLESLVVELNGQETIFIESASYDARGRRAQVVYGNGAVTRYLLDRLTSRLARQTTTRGGVGLQDLHYTYDSVGNVTRIVDEAQQDVYFANAVVSASSSYSYDALYRLIRAEGREHVGQGGPPEPSWRDGHRVNLAHPHDGQAMRRYAQDYFYDLAGNLIKLKHDAPLGGSWTRRYEYAEQSLLEPGKFGNRLSSTKVGTRSTEPHSYDEHGNMLAMPHLTQIDWDFADRLRFVNLGGGGQAHYNYDGAGQRIRKVVVRNGGSIFEERIYLGDFELFRKRNASGDVQLERRTLHVTDDTERVALVETRTVGQDPGPEFLVRYQLANHQHSVGVELDDLGRVLSYEEYYPYGATSFQSHSTDTPKRYRFVGMERDEESGLNYHGARYYAPWLGRWVSCDPSGVAGGPNLYAYVACSPVTFFDDDGCDKKKKKKSGATSGGAQKKTNPLKQRRAVGKATEQLWKANFESRPDTTNVIEQSKFKDKNTLKSSTAGGRFRQPDFGLERTAAPDVVVEIGAKPETLQSSQKEWQKKLDDTNIGKGNLYGDEAKGYIKPEQSVGKGGFPVVDPGGNTALPGDPEICPNCKRQNSLAQIVDIDLQKSKLAKLGKSLAKLGPIGTFVGLISAGALIAEGKPLAAIKELVGALPLIGDIVDLFDLGHSVFGWIFGGKSKPKPKKINIDDYLTPMSEDEELVAVTWDPEESKQQSEPAEKEKAQGEPDKERWIDLGGLTIGMKRVKAGTGSAILRLPLSTGAGPMWQWDEYLLLDLALTRAFDLRLRGTNEGLGVTGRF